ncbi:MAG: peptide chain release factor 2, partial [Saprospiraceae bacterium]
MLRIEDKEQITLDPDFWTNPDSARIVIKALNIDKTWVNAYNHLNTLVEDTEILFEFSKEGEAS